MTQHQMLHFAQEALGFAASTSPEFSPLKGRGSDRTFFRLTWKGTGSAILIHYNPKRIENAYYADIATFLHEIGLPVPRIFRHDPARCLVLMEDLGGRDLWSFRTSPWHIRRILYQKTIAIVQRLRSVSEKDLFARRVRLTDGFGPDLYRWERDYFRTHFVKNFCGLKLAPHFERELEAELSALAERLDNGIRALLHRDLQSQNVMIRDGEPFLIDFQGMRFGNPFYDLGSLLCDPYVDFSRDERDELVLFYYQLSQSGLDLPTFQTCFWEASVQRLMQALGAYGFLGVGKGLTAFMEYIPAALRNLFHAASHTPLLPRLPELLRMCDEAIEHGA